MNRAEKRRQQKLAGKMAKGKQPGKMAEGRQPGGPTLNINQTLNTAAQHHSNGRLAEAVTLYQQVLQADPNHPVALQLLGVTALQVGNNEDAVALISKAIAIKPDYADAHNNLGNALKNMAKMDDALACYQQAISINPEYADAHSNLGTVLADQGKFDEAVASYDKAIAINPGYAEAYFNRGLALQSLEHSDEAVASYRKAIEIKPNYALAHSSLIFIQDLIPNIDQSEQQAERRLWNERFIRPLAGKILIHTNARDPERRLRIGYVSADFRLHSAYLGFSPLIMDFDHENFDVICYDATLDGDTVSEALRQSATAWRPIKNKTDEEVARIIRDDAIDILVDLSGHTVDNRLSVFGYKPAPLQLTGIGHLPSGLSTIDYRLTTPLMTPPEEETIYPESPIYLNAFCAYTPPPDSPPIVASPCRQNGFITFGFLGRYSKTSKDLLALWASILRDVPGSRLLLKFAQLDDPAVRQNIIQTFSSFGIAEDRLIVLGKTDQRAHLEAHNLVDIVFDTFPHGGGITTLDSLWMGVPVIGQMNPKKAGGRMIESICQPLGLTDCVAESSAEYHAIALDWATRVEDLSHLRQGLRERFSNVYFRFHQDVEKSYRLIWRRWCAGEAPSPLYPETARI